MTSRPGRILALLVLAAFAAPAAGCGGGDEADAVAAKASTNTIALADRKWKKVAPGGDCECADGSEFAFWERRADPAKVVFFLDGGGACFDATTCAFVPESYDWKVNDDPAEENGIFNFARADNPFLDYSFIYVPSCAGDVHLGDVTRKYSPQLTVEHKGFVNGGTLLRYLAKHYSNAAQVVVVGKSVGSIAAPVYGGLAADLLPHAQVTVFGAQSGHVPDDADLNASFFGELWGAYANMPDWEVNPGLYELEVNGEKLVDWVRRLIEGKPVDDVHCQKCRVG